MFTQVLPIMDKIQSDLITPITSLVHGITINLDEPLNLVYTDLPTLCIYPVKEDFDYNGSDNVQDKKNLFLRLELRMKKGPASTVCTPVINQIVATLKADRTLGGLADYVEFQTIQFANEQTESGQVCGASLDIQVDYLT